MIRIPKCKVRLLIFILYNLSFVLYMVGKISNIYYLIFISLFCVTNFITLISNKKIILNTCFKEFKLGISYVLFFFVISLLKQMWNQDFQFSILFNDIIRLAIPIISAFLFVNTVEKEEQDIFFNIFLLRFILQFILTNIGNISLNNIINISWANSSSAMESSLAHDFIIMEMFYLMINKKKYAFICMIFCMLSLKRLSFILAPLLMLISIKVPQKCEVKRKYITILKLFAVLSPFIMIGIYSTEFRRFVFENFGFDLSRFMSGRIEIYELLVNNIPYYNGLGSINFFLSNFVFKYFGTTWNGILHNDFLRLFFETTFIGVVLFSNNLIEFGKKNYWIFFMISYLIFVAITSHILNYFSVWVTLYMAIMYQVCLNNKEG